MLFFKKRKWFRLKNDHIQSFTITLYTTELQKNDMVVKELEKLSDSSLWSLIGSMIQKSQFDAMYCLLLVHNCRVCILYNQDKLF